MLCTMHGSYHILTAHLQNAMIYKTGHDLNIQLATFAIPSMYLCEVSCRYGMLLQAQQKSV